MARVTTAQVERFYELLAAKRIPFMQGRIRVNLSSRSSYIYQARRNGAGVKLKLNFMPGSNGWERRFSRALTAAVHILFRQSHAVEIRLDKALEWPEWIVRPFLKLREDLGRVRDGYYLPKETQQWRRLLTP